MTWGQRFPPACWICPTSTVHLSCTAEQDNVDVKPSKSGRGSMPFTEQTGFGNKERAFSESSVLFRSSLQSQGFQPFLVQAKANSVGSNAFI